MKKLKKDIDFNINKVVLQKKLVVVFYLELNLHKIQEKIHFMIKKLK